MHHIKSELESRIYNLKQIIKKKEEELSVVPEGSVHICQSGNRIQFYLKKDGRRIYLKESQSKLVEKLIRKDYDQKVLAAAKKELKELEKLSKNYPKTTCEEIFEKLHEERKRVVNSIWVPDQEYVEQWEAEEYVKKGFREGAPEYYTNKGERVRSKTEILIANALEKHKIPYHYEKPLNLNSYLTVHPDFTILNVRKRKEIYWEHLGMMDDPEYCEHALGRINAYEMEGIFPGDGLILTHETGKMPINSKMIEKMIVQYLK